jgi:hypothetical protein
MGMWRTFSDSRQRWHWRRRKDISPRCCCCCCCCWRERHPWLTRLLCHTTSLRHRINSGVCGGNTVTVLLLVGKHVGETRQGRREPVLRMEEGGAVASRSLASRSCPCMCSCGIADDGGSEWGRRGGLKQGRSKRRSRDMPAMRCCCLVRRKTSRGRVDGLARGRSRGKRLIGIVRCRGFRQQFPKDVRLHIRYFCVQRMFAS